MALKRGTRGYTYPGWIGGGVVCLAFMAALIVFVWLMGAWAGAHATDYSAEEFWRNRRWADDAFHEGGRVRGAPRYRTHRAHRAHRSPPPVSVPDPIPDIVHYYGAPVDRSRNDVMYAGTQRIQRDVLSNVVCFPQIEELSVEANTEDGAWKDAQRAFENRARWMYGERAMSIQNAIDIRRQCSRSSGNQSAVGRAVESMASAVGLEGYKHRCAIIARPCLAPIQHDPDIKTDR